MKTREEEVEDFIRSYFKKFDRGRVNPVLKLLSSEGIVVFGKERFSGKRSIKGFYTEFFERVTNGDHKLRNLRVETSGFEAIAICDWTFTAHIIKIGKACKMEGRCRFRLLYEDDRWMITELGIYPNLMKTLIRHGLINFIKLGRAKDQFRFAKI
ncbi:MAG: nuclear transport factor 2 family protein [Candidatus Hydrothermarchaeales archaeon]